MASSDKMEENIESPVGTNGYAGSIFVCLPTAFAQMKKIEVCQSRSRRTSNPSIGRNGGARTIETLLRTAALRNSDAL